MGKNNPYSPPSTLGTTKKEIHPIWRGIGFIFIILIPILSFFGSIVLLDENAKRGWFRIPSDLIVPLWDPLLGIKLIITIFLMFILYSLFKLVSFIVFGILAPPRYGPFDVPPQRYRGKKRPR